MTAPLRFLARFDASTTGTPSQFERVVMQFNLRLLRAVTVTVSTSPLTMTETPGALRVAPVRVGADTSASGLRAING